VNISQPKLRSDKFDDDDDDNDNNNRNLTIHTQNICNIKIKVISEGIIMTTGTISKSFRKYLSNLTGKHDNKKLQKTATLRNANILRKEILINYNKYHYMERQRQSSYCIGLDRF